MEKVTKKIKRTILGDFMPEIEIGDKLEPGKIIGTADMPQIVQEAHIEKGSKVLVDDGIFVSEKTPLLQRQTGLYKEAVLASQDGVVRIQGEKLTLISGQKKKKIRSDLWGRVLMVSADEYIAEAVLYKFPILVSLGGTYEGPIMLINDSGPVISSKLITEQVKGKLVILAGTLTYQTYKLLVEYGAEGVIAASINWEDYTQVFHDPKIGVGILQGFGKLKLWKWFTELFDQKHEIYVEADFKESFLYLPFSDIMMSSIEKEIYIFKDVLWGKKVKDIGQIADGMIAVLDSKEKTPATEEELQKII